VSEVLAELRQRGLYIETWGAEEIGADLARIGLGGSPTKVKKVDSVVLRGRSLRFFSPDDKGVKELVGELIEERTFG